MHEKEAWKRGPRVGRIEMQRLVVELSEVWEVKVIDKDVRLALRNVAHKVVEGIKSVMMVGAHHQAVARLMLDRLGRVGDPSSALERGPLVRARTFLLDDVAVVQCGADLEATNNTSQAIAAVDACVESFGGRAAGRMN